MTRAFFFLTAYGLLVLFGFFLAGFWGIMANRRRKLVWHFGGSILHDRYYIVCLATAVFSAGVLFDAIGRLIGNLQFGLSAILKRGEAFIIGPGLLLMLVGAVLMVWLADIERHPPTWRWMWGAGILTIIWTGVAFVLADHLPLGGY